MRNKVSDVAEDVTSTARDTGSAAGRLVGGTASTVGRGLSGTASAVGRAVTGAASSAGSAAGATVGSAARSIRRRLPGGKTSNVPEVIEGRNRRRLLLAAVGTAGAAGVAVVVLRARRSSRSAELPVDETLAMPADAVAEPVAETTESDASALEDIAVETPDGRSVPASGDTGSGETSSTRKRTRSHSGKANATGGSGGKPRRTPAARRSASSDAATDGSTPNGSAS